MSSDEDCDGPNPWREDDTVEDPLAASSRQPFRVPQAGSPLADLRRFTTQELTFALVGEGLKCHGQHGDLVKRLHRAPSPEEKRRRPWRQERKRKQESVTEAKPPETSMPGAFCHYDRLRHACISPVPEAKPPDSVTSNILRVEIPPNVAQGDVEFFVVKEYGFVEADFVSEACCMVKYKTIFWANRAKTAIERFMLLHCTFAGPAKTSGDSIVPPAFSAIKDLRDI